jgi:hypothetical protein
MAGFCRSIATVPSAGHVSHGPPVAGKMANFGKISDNSDPFFDEYASDTFHGAGALILTGKTLNDTLGTIPERS